MSDDLDDIHTVAAPNGAPEGNNVAEIPNEQIQDERSQDTSDASAAEERQRRQSGDPVPPSQRRSQVQKKMLTILKKLKELCKEMGPSTCFALVFAAPLLNRKKEEHVETIIKASDDCLLSAMGCFKAEGSWRLDKHMSAAVLQALALQEDLSGVKELRDKDPKSFRTTERLVVWLRAAVKERVNAERKAAGEDEKAHVYARHARPEWWPEGWDWSSRALEAANRLQLEAFFLPMRDWRASHQETEVRAAVARKRGQHRPARGEDTEGGESEDASAAEVSECLPAADRESGSSAMLTASEGLSSEEEDAAVQGPPAQARTPVASIGRNGTRGRGRGTRGRSASRGKRGARGRGGGSTATVDMEGEPNHGASEAQMSADPAPDGVGISDGGGRGARRPSRRGRGLESATVAAAAGSGEAERQRPRPASRLKRIYAIGSDTSSAKRKALEEREAREEAEILQPVFGEGLSAHDNEREVLQPSRREARSGQAHGSESAEEQLGARRRNQRVPVPDKRHLSRVLHLILDDESKEKRVMGSRKTLFNQRKAGEGIDEDDIEIRTFVHITADDFPVIEFLRSCTGAFTPQGRSNFEANLKALNL